MLCDCNQQRMLQYNVCKCNKYVTISITQAAAVITTYIGCNWDTPSNFDIMAPATSGSSTYTTKYYEALNGHQTHSQRVTPYSVVESDRRATNMYGSIGTSIGTANAGDYNQYGQLVIYADVYAKSPKDQHTLQITINMSATYSPR